MKKNYKIPADAHPPEARPAAGTEVTVNFATEKDAVCLRMTRAQAEALRASLKDALRILDHVAASKGVGPPPEK